MTSIKIILAGIVLILSSLFFMGFAIISGALAGLAVTLFILGILVCILGFVWDIKT